MTVHQTIATKRLAFDLRSLFVGLGLVLALVAATPAPINAAQNTDIVTIQQVSSGRYLDAWDDGTHGYNVVTRDEQNNTSQRWIIHWSDNGMGTLQQESTYRFLDAHEISEMDYQLVTRPQQTDNTQLWEINSVGGGLYTLKQISSGRYMDAHEIAEKDFAVVTRNKQDNDTQLWRLTVVGR